MNAPNTKGFRKAFGPLGPQWVLKIFMLIFFTSHIDQIGPNRVWKHFVLGGNQNPCNPNGVLMAPNTNAYRKAFGPVGPQWVLKFFMLIFFISHVDQIGPNRF